MVKIRVYINAMEPTALDFADVLTLGHACDSPGERISSGIQHMPKDSSSSMLVSDEEKKAVEVIEQFSKENSLDYEVIDLGKAGPVTRLKFVMKGWRVPVICFEKETIVGLPTKEQLDSMLRKHQACQRSP